MTITWPSENERVTIIDSIRDTIGRDITIVVQGSGIPCPNPADSLNPITNLSTNQFCPICSGKYWIEDTYAVTVLGVVSWKGADMQNWVPGGILFDGDCLVQIKYTPSSIYYVDNALSFTVDEKEMIKEDILLRGVPEINRILITMIQKEK